MDIDHTALDLRSDPRRQRMTGWTHHGNLEIDVPYVSQITPDLWVGGCMDGLHLPAEISHVVSLYPWERYVLGAHQTRTEIRMHDSLDQDLSRVWEIADAVLEAQKTGPVLVHCQAGLNRSGLVAAAVLIREGSLPAVAIKRLRTLRSPAVLCNPAFEAWLLAQAPKDERRPGAKRGEPGYRPAETFAPCEPRSHKAGCRCTSSTDCCEGTPVSHNGSRMCQSGSIASGGQRSHCTCDRCF